MSAFPGAALNTLLIEDTSTDGRVARGQRTRRRVAETLVTLLREGDPDPTAKSIAERAGVSLRLVFHHFSDMDDLYRTVFALQLEHVQGALPDVSPALPQPVRIEDTVRHRSTLYEEISPVRRAAVRRSRSSADVMTTIALNDVVLKESLSATFAPELAVVPPTEGAELLAALDAASSWETWERLRHSTALSVVGARGIMTRTLAALLAPHQDA